ncbi:Carbohydrate binding module (family 35) [Ruminococcus sp. YRD2003]|uniref:glycosyl hydrolase n=1 Tax=Ruminococcus sp. YRD2003 TaxID=1452313 RepID=UPI0008D03904|nr:Carbohydrate binding module (family 35) [Ruminococcus flavefaciens]
MKNVFLKRASALAMSAALALNGSAAGSAVRFTADAADDAKFEFEDADVTGKTAPETDSAASGGSVLYMKDDGVIEMEFEVASAGMYDLVIYAHGVGGSKQQDLYINDASQGSLSIPEGDTYQPIKSAVKLNAGKNTLKIKSSWGWTMFDYFTVGTTVLPDIKASQTTPCDPLATKETQSLMAYLNSVYGKNIISGQQEIYSGGPHGLETEFEYLKDTTGHYPAIRGFDYGNFCCPAYGSDDGSTKRIIDWVKEKNGIATASFHINVPNKMESYTIGDRIDWAQTSYSAKDNDFSPKKAYTKGTKEYDYYRQSLETLAAEFKKLEAEGVPVIWRPLHEAEGGGGETGSWFWWGKEGSAVYKELWKYTYTTLTEDFDCHNLIWEWNSYNFDTSANWYPGDDYVDIIGYDKYSCVKYLAENNWQASYVHDDGSYSSTFYSIMEKYDSKKMVSMAENDSFSTVGNLTEDKAGWLYFCTWYDGGGKTNFLSDPIFNTKEDTIEMYQSDYCITLDELPEDLYKNGTDPDPSTTRATKATTTTVSTTAATTTTTSDAFTFKVMKQKVELPEGSKEGCTLEYTIKGAPKASLGGAFGFGTSADDWTNIEWKGDASADGELIGSIKLDEVPDSMTTGEFQIWWSNVWDAAAEKGIDQPCEITDLSVITDVVPVSSTTSTTVTNATTTVTTSAEAVKATLIGDANLDQKVSVADAVAILQSIANEDKYGLKPVGKANADCCDVGDGVTAKDALAIQRLDAKVIDKLPETTK